MKSFPVIHAYETNCLSGFIRYCEIGMRRIFFTLWVKKRALIIGGVLAGGAVSSLSAYQGTPAVSDELRRAPIQLGIQLMSGYRTNAIWRGVPIAEQVGEFQIASSVAVSNNWALAGEFDYARGFVGQKGSHSTLYSELQYYLGEEMTLGPLVAGQWYRNCDFKNGLDTGIVWRWTPTRDWESQAQALYDSGQKGWYGQLAITWQPLISESTAWQTTVALGGAKDYLGTNGTNDATLRTGCLIRLGASLRLQPFIAYSWGFGNKNTRCFYGGLWFVWQF